MCSAERRKMGAEAPNSPKIRARERLRPSNYYLARRNASAKWETIQHWKQALNQFEMLWGDRISSRPRPVPYGK